MMPTFRKKNLLLIKRRRSNSRPARAKNSGPSRTVVEASQDPTFPTPADRNSGGTGKFEFPEDASAARPHPPPRGSRAAAHIHTHGASKVPGLRAPRRLDAAKHLVLLETLTTLNYCRNDAFALELSRTPLSVRGTFVVNGGSGIARSACSARG